MGADKGLDMSELIKEIPKHCKAVILLSETGTEKLKQESGIRNKAKQQIHNSLFIIPNAKIVQKETKSLKQAFNLAMKNAKKNDIVLFSPAFASFGMFKNEYDREERFNSLVNRL